MKRISIVVASAIAFVTLIACTGDSKASATSTRYGYYHGNLLAEVQKQNASADYWLIVKNRRLRTRVRLLRIEVRGRRVQVRRMRRVIAWQNVVIQRLRARLVACERRREP